MQERAGKHGFLHRLGTINAILAVRMSESRDLDFQRGFEGTLRASSPRLSRGSQEKPQSVGRCEPRYQERMWGRQRKLT